MPESREGGNVGLKILHSADWHLDSPFAAFAPEDGDYLRRQSRRIPGEIAQLCRREGCNLMLLAGDLFDGPYTRERLPELREALKYAGVPVFISPAPGVRPARPDWTTPPPARVPNTRWVGSTATPGPPPPPTAR